MQSSAAMCIKDKKAYAVYVRLIRRRQFALAGGAKQQAPGVLMVSGHTADAFRARLGGAGRGRTPSHYQLPRNNDFDVHNNATCLR